MLLPQFLNYLLSVPFFQPSQTRCTLRTAGFFYLHRWGIHSGSPGSVAQRPAILILQFGGDVEVRRTQLAANGRQQEPVQQQRCSAGGLGAE